MAADNMRLRNAVPQDAKNIHRLFCVPQVFEYLADGKEPPPSIAAQWITAAEADRVEYGGGLWVIVDRPDLNVAGLVRLAGDGDGALELTYVVHPDWWGRGLATRMAHTAMMHAFRAGLVATIWAGADTPNTASLAVMRRLGMWFWREVQYPLGAGMEYRIEAEAFDPARIEPLPIA